MQRRPLVLLLLLAALAVLAVAPSGQELTGGHVDEVRQLGRAIVLDPDNFADDTDWAVLNDATSGKTTNTDSVTETAALEFDKVDGSGFTVAGLDRTIPSVNLCHAVGWYLEGIIKVTSVNDVADVVVYLGTDDSNYNAWQYAGEDLNTDRWSAFQIPVWETIGATGNGWDCSAVTYVFYGVSFDAEDDALANIRLDDLRLVRGDPVHRLDRELDTLLDTMIAAFDSVTVDAWSVTGGTPGYKLDVDENGDNIKTSAAELYMLCAVNMTADPIYLKLFNDIVANVTLGTTAIAQTIPVPSLGGTDGAGICPPLVGGERFSVALSVFATTGAADSDTTGPATNALHIFHSYK